MEYVPPPNPQAYYAKVWQIVQQVPHGLVVTYGQIAKMIPAPEGITAEEYKVFGSRWVGNGMAACPADVPWQRVINSQGKISNWPRAKEQHQRLLAEGVLFKNDKIDLKYYQWKGPGHENEPRQARLI